MFSAFLPENMIHSFVKALTTCFTHRTHGAVNEASSSWQVRQSLKEIDLSSSS
jgi:hypothetical protein